MYTPPHFQAQSQEEVEAFVKANSFAILVSQQSGKPLATHLPLLWVEKEDKTVLWGHWSRANPQWQDIAGQSVLAIFHGPHAYVSSSWYNHVNVPTWNYIAVHIYGTIRIIEGEELERSLHLLVGKYEADSEHPFQIEQLGSQKFNREMRGIVGLELEVEEIQAAFKLSQNRNAEDYQNIISKLDDKGGEDQAVAQAMKQIKR